MNTLFALLLSTQSLALMGTVSELTGTLTLEPTGTVLKKSLLRMSQHQR
ncbi:MAG: hypothetical protein KA715_07810 [Xanthomonadaceae bacterium]|nr:hypothetical protein [Xanthomonadaceae bacterium]